MEVLVDSSRPSSCTTVANTSGHSVKDNHQTGVTTHPPKGHMLQEGLLPEDGLVDKALMVGGRLGDAGPIGGGLAGSG